MITQSRARELLARWARNNDMRDKIVIRSYHAGISKREISIVTGIARTTIDRIIARHVPELFTPRQAGVVSRETLSVVQVREVGVQAADRGEDGDAEPQRPSAVG